MKENKKVIYFHQNVEYERNRLKMTQKELSEKLGLKAPSAILKWEKKGSFPEIQTLISLCIIFNRGLDEIMFEDLAGRPIPKQPPEPIPSTAHQPTESPPSVIPTEGGLKNKDPVREALREIVREELAKILQ